jgi:hypothetical protein
VRTEGERKTDIEGIWGLMLAYCRSKKELGLPATWTESQRFIQQLQLARKMLEAQLTA